MVEVLTFRAERSVPMDDSTSVMEKVSGILSESGFTVTKAKVVDRVPSDLGELSDQIEKVFSENFFLGKDPYLAVASVVFCSMPEAVSAKELLMAKLLCSTFDGKEVYKA